MPYGDDITEGLPYTLSNPAGSTNYSATGEAYDIAIAGLPFFLLNSDEAPYRRVTAQYRKQQIDQSREPGEQTLTGWWLRSQSSFHYGQGIKFFEPIQDESLRFQYTESKGIDVWTKGQATLLKSCVSQHITTGGIQTNGRPWQYMRSISWNSTQAVLLVDEYDVDKIIATTFTYAKTASDVLSTAVSPLGTGTPEVVHFIDYNSGTDYPVHAICDDGVYAYWVTNVLTSGTPRLRVYKKLLSDNSSVSPTLMFSDNGITVTNAVMEYTKERIVIVRQRLCLHWLVLSLQQNYQ
jgi:hypothetical protein